MILQLNVKGLTITEKEDLLKQLNLIKDKVYPDLNIEYSILKHSSNWISIKQEINDSEKALFLFKCLQELHIHHKPDEYYKIYEDVELTISLNTTRKWEYKKN